MAELVTVRGILEELEPQSVRLYRYLVVQPAHTQRTNQLEQAVKSLDVCIGLLRGVLASEPCIQD